MRLRKIGEPQQVTIALSSQQPTLQNIRRKLWVDVVVAVAASDNATQKDSMVRWADYAVDEFDNRVAQGLI